MTNSNGTPGGEGTAVTFALDEGYQFGLGVFETINLTGGRLVMLDRHLDRLRRGARALDIDAPDDDTLRAHIAEHLDAAELPDGRSFAVKLMVSSANVIVTHRPNPYADWAQDRGLRLGWCRAWRNECSPLTAHKTLNQGDNILESRSAWRLGFDSAVYSTRAATSARPPTRTCSSCATGGCTRRTSDAGCYPAPCGRGCANDTRPSRGPSDRIRWTAGMTVFATNA